MKKDRKDGPKRREQELAWIGDTVLDLFARSWILETHGSLCGEKLRNMTSNQFLSAIGNPTAVEAIIGKLYQEEGLEAAFAWIDERLVPIFQKQEKNRR